MNNDAEGAASKSTGGHGNTRLRFDLELFIPIACLIVLADQISKHFARMYLTVGDSVHVIPGLFDFQLVYNRGAAFSLMQNATVYFLIVATVIVAGCILYLCLASGHTRFEVVTLALICSGAIGNALDRLLLDGAVTDFIATAFIDFPIFNVADSAITIGCICFAIACIRRSRDIKALPSEGTDADGSADAQDR